MQKNQFKIVILSLINFLSFQAKFNPNLVSSSFQTKCDKSIYFGNTVFDLLLKWHHKYSLFVLITSFLGIPQAFVHFYRPMFAFISSSKGLKTRHHFFLKCLHFHSEKKQRLIATINFVKWSINAHNNIEVESLITPT